MDAHELESRILSGSGDVNLKKKDDKISVHGDNCENVSFLPKKDKVCHDDDEYHLLTKDELLMLEKDQKVYRFVRIGLIAVFWITWLGLLAGSIWIIVATPKCPPRPNLEFWQSKVGYWVNPFTFKDSDSDLIGDLKGLASAAGYIDTDVGAGFVILGSLSPWYPKDIPVKSDYVPSFKSIHPALGTMNDLHSTIRTFKKLGKEVILSIDFNGVPVNHEYVGRPGFLKQYTSSMMPGRTGEPKISISGVEYYSTYGSSSGMVDLDLTNSDVIDEIKETTRFWLAKGIDGILLSDAAFYVENHNCNSSDWFSSFPHCKLYTNETIEIIQTIRDIVDEVSVATGRHKVLIADAGNTGYGVDLIDRSLLLLGTDTIPAAHLVISRQFSKNRGWKVSDVHSETIKEYKSLVGNRTMNVALSVSTPTDIPYQSLYSTAAAFLLPGTSIIYAGSELGWAPLPVLPPAELYPFNDEPVPNVLHDTILSSHLPMPWDMFGKGFSTNNDTKSLYLQYMQSAHVNETVESVLAAGREYNLFNLTTDLLHLRLTEPSLLWGEFSMDTSFIPVPEMEIFKRNASGFDNIIVVLLNEKTPASVVDMSSECTSLTPILVYSSNSLLEKGKNLQSTKVYFAKPTKAALYVFKCIE